MESLSIKSKSSLVIFLGFFLLLFHGCKKSEFNFSDVPFIQLNSVKIIQAPDGFDSSIVFNLYYQDGNGDIGYNENDTFTPFNFGSYFFNNLHIDYFEKKNGILNPILIPPGGETLTFSDRLPWLTPTGKRKAIKGNLEIRLNANPYPGIKPDSVVFKISISDRSLQKSNEVSTAILKLNLR